MEENNKIDSLSAMENRIEREEITGNQLFGQFLVIVAALYIVEIIAKIAVRVIFGNTSTVAAGCEIYIGYARILLVLGAFMFFLSKIRKMFFHSPYTKKLIVVWAVILIPIQFINDLTAMMYTRMLVLVQHVFLEAGIDGDGQIYALLYDTTHGFKYICMFLAILLGIVMTAEILEKKILHVMAAGFAILYMLAFVVLRMIPVESASVLTVGINWTSLLFHSLTTIGMLSVGLFIMKSFKLHYSYKED